MEAESIDARLAEIHVVAGFTAEPVRNVLIGRLASLGIEATVDFAPLGQMFQQMLDDASGLKRAAGGINVFLLRADDFLTLQARESFRVDGVREFPDDSVRDLLDGFAAALERFHSANRSRSVVLVCSSLLELEYRNSPSVERLSRIEDDIFARLSGNPAVAGVLVRDFHVGDPLNLLDSARNEIAQIPFSEHYFSLLSKVLALRIAALRGFEHKVVLLDADGTLWQGVCGEQDPDTLTISASQQHLQVLLKEAKRQGMLLALVSKNNPDDVHRVFRENSGMALALDDFVTTRINWQSKSQNVADIAAELDLSPDSFIFIDDNPVELAEVESFQPGVLLLPVPPQPTALRSMLDRSWLFHKNETSQEDGRRTQFYATNQQRREFQSSFGDLKSFIRGLGIEVVFRPLDASNLYRAAQLTARTNQFNLRKRIRSSTELQALIATAGTHGFCVQVQDRFGDYGVTGLVIALQDRDIGELVVDTFLLSCRVLGRHVEFCVLDRLQVLARSLQCNCLRLPLELSEKNTPIRTFLERHFDQYGSTASSGGKVDYRIPPDAVAFAEELHSIVARDAAPDFNEVQPGSSRKEQPELSAGLSQERTEIEAQLCRLVSESLSLGRIVDVHENYFSLGGDSLKAVDLVVRARKSGLQFTLEDVVASDTIQDIAKVTAREATPPRVPRLRDPFALLSATEKYFVDAKYDLLELENAFPLSMLQRGMIFHSLKDREQGLYQNILCWQVRCQWNEKAFVRALRSVQQRHESLRSVFALDSGERPLQIVRREARLELEIDDLRESPREAQDHQLRRWVESQRQRGVGFDGLPWRVAVHVLSDDKLHVSVVVHHALLDGWSNRRWVTELVTNYLKFAGGELPRARSAPPSYAALVELELEALEQQTSREFWVEQLRGAVLPRWAGPRRSESVSLRYVVPRPMLRLVRDLAKQRGLQEKSLWCSAFAALLAVIGGDERVLAAVVTHSRPELEGIDESLGVFLNALPLVGNLRDRSWEHMADDINRALQLQFKHRFYPSAQIQFDTGLDLSSALFNFIQSDTTSGGVHPEVSPFTQEYTNFLFTFTVEVNAAKDGDTCIVLDVAAKALCETVQRQLLPYVHRILELITTRGSKPFRIEDVLDTAERHQLLEWNATEMEYASEQTLHGLFEEGVARHPQRIALRVEGACLTYEELNRRANRRAHELLALGLKREECVGICLPRTQHSVISVLAVLKAGGCYVPIDPSYPAQRVRYMLSDAQMKWVITSRELRERLGIEEHKCVYVEGREESARDSNPDVEIGSQQLAYVIYTSGSTGHPKGVGIAHQGAVSLLQWAQGMLAPEQREAVLASTSLSFDLSMYELFLPLTSGHSCILVDNVLALQSLDEGSRASLRLVNTVPSAAKALLDRGALPRSVRVLNLAGEPLKAALVDRLYAQTGVERIYDLYGPSECTTYSSFTLRQSQGIETIGRPVANTQFYVLSARGELVPQGVIGELYIGGVGVARGYLHRPALTAEKFIPDRFSGRSGSRLYRTGDLVRYLAQGNLEYVGRTDQQVKVRGYRIELGEIESAITQHAAVKDAVVIVRTDTPEHPQIVAYVVPREVQEAADQAEPAWMGELKQRLQQGLPGYMMPARFVVLSSVPLTPNGKLDRAALPAPQEASTGHEYAAPQGPVEIGIAALWEQLLRRKPVGRNDNFFELGGHSLLAMQLISSIRERFSVELSLNEVFANLGLVELAICVSNSMGAAQTTSAISIAKSSARLLSYSQQRLWFLAQLEGSNPTYNIPKIFALHRQVDAATLRETLQAIVDRHESLRSSFAEQAGKPCLRIDGSQQVALPLEHIDTVLRWNEMCAEERAKPFDLQKDRLYRFKLVTRSVSATESQCFLFATFHHAVFDGLSVAVFVEELQLIYDGLASKEPAQLEPLTLQYCDFADWQQQRIKSGEFRSQEDYWRAQLAQLPPFLDLPTDHLRRTERTSRGAWVAMDIGEATAAKVTALARDRGSTAFMALLAAFATVLYRYSGQSDIAIGTPIANRPHGDLKNLIGFFVNTLVMRCAPSDRKTFIELLDEVRGTVLGALANQDIPFDLLVEALNPIRGLNASPLFQVMFAIQNEEADSDDIRAGWVEDLDRSDGVGGDWRAGVAHFDLTLLVRVTAQGWRCKLEYATDLFEAGTAQSILETYRAVLESVARSPGKTLAAFEIISAQDRDRQLIAWNQTTADFQRERFVHETFERRVASTPDAIALVYEDRSISFRELNNRANFLARHVLGLNLGVEARVGLYFERSIEMVIGVLGVIKAGACYVPLDPTSPQDRTRFILTEADIQVVLSNVDAPQMLQRESRWLNVPLILQRGYASAEKYADIPSTAVGLEPENLVYWLYTSGSTGRPKGVMIRHAGLANLCQDSIKRRGFNGECRNLQFAPLIFDAAAAEIFNSLLSGSILHIPRSEVLTDREEFRRYSKRHSINRGYIPPAFLGVLDRNDFSSYRSLSVGGEAIPPDIARQWSQVCTLTNAYGPTECTIACTSGMLDGSEAVSIGTFLSNVHGYVLNDSLQLVPVGATGELCIGGVCLARGYAADSKLTAAKFVPNPFSPEDGARLYRTGDLVRYRRDGKLEFLGRKDQQVKLRGFRIELGEIESYLGQHPRIHAAVASVQGEGEDRKIVVHFVADDEASAPEAAELREFSQRGLPGYMVPSAFARVMKFPLTAGGKIDRRSLPQVQVEAQRRFDPPRGADEASMAALWAEVLEVERVGRLDNFFELGGHSLLATHLVARAREKFATHISVRDLFENQTLDSFAAIVTQRTSTGPALTPMVSIEDRSQRPLALSPAQTRLWFLQKFSGDSAVWNIPVALELRGRLNPEKLNDAIVRVLTRHEVLRTRIVESGGEPHPVIDPLPRAVMSREIARSEEELQRLCRRERRTTFSLSSGQLYRFCLFSVQQGATSTQHGTRHVLHMTLHHIVCDGISVAILLGELARYYNATEEAQEIVEPLIQYGDFVAWQNRQASGAHFEKQIEYWRTALAGLPPVLNLPLDAVRPRQQSFRGATRKRRIGAKTCEALKALGKAQNATLFMTLMAAFAVLLGRYARQAEFAIGTAVSNREAPGAHRAIGLFLNMLVFRFSLHLDRSFVALLGDARTTAIDAYRHQDVPFELLVETLNPERNLSYSPFFQVLFSAVESSLEGVVFHELDAALLDAEDNDGVARYDLAFSLVETDEGVNGTMEYNTDLFTGARIEGMLVHYERLLEAIVSAPTRAVGRLEFLREEEREEQRSGWNVERFEADEEQNVYELLQRWTARTPEAIAVCVGDESYSYGFVEEAAAAIGAALAQRGLGAQSRVGIAVDRSFEMLAAVLGCLRAGICYVPLDPQLPAARVEYIARDARIDLFIGELGEAAGVSARMSVQELKQCIQRGGEGWGRGRTAAKQLAYVIYTSGSTGQPKGVGVSQGNLVNLVKGIQERPCVQQSDRMLAVTTLSFDIAFLELFVPLASGGLVDIARAEQVYDARQLMQRMERLRISCMQATPSTWKLLLDADWRGASELKALVGGEALGVELAQRLVPKVKQLWNMYGPTETTIWSTASPIGAGPVRIGRPLRNTTAYVLDEAGGLVPAGVVGELYLGGEGVAWGYVNRASLTAQRFVPDPFADERRAGSRLYRTGDLVRSDEQGNLEYLGREDDQVKVRGYRIELGEIEQALLQSPSVKDAVVAVREDGSGNRYIAAYVIAPQIGQEELVSELTERLHRQLPAYMVPSAYVRVERFALTGSGKVDRNALPSPQESLVARGYAAPQGRFEQGVASIWEEILRRERVGREDNFFELGGHSLLVTQMAARVAGEFKVAVPLRDFFEFGPLRRIAARIAHLSSLQTMDEDAVEQMSDEEVRKLLSELEA